MSDNNATAALPNGHDSNSEALNVNVTAKPITETNPTNPLAKLNELGKLPKVVDPKSIEAGVRKEVTATRRRIQEIATTKLQYEDVMTTLGSIQRRLDGEADLSPMYLEQLSAAQQGLALIGELDQETQSRVDFAEFITLVKGCDPKDQKTVQLYIDSAVEAKRYHLITQEEVDTARGNKEGLPQHVLFFHGKVYLPTVFKEPAPGQYALERELVKLIMKSRGSERTMTDFLKARDGYYYLYSPKGRGDKSDGHLLVKLFRYNEERNDGGERSDPQIRILSAVGNVRSLGDNKQGRVTIPYEWVRLGRVNSMRRLDEHDFNRALLMARTLNSIANFPSQQPRTRPGEEKLSAKSSN